MNNDFFDNLKNTNPERLNQTSDVIKKALGEDFDINKLMENEKFKQKFNMKLSPADKQKIGSLLSNPELLKKLLTIPQVREGIKGFLKE